MANELLKPLLEISENTSNIAQKSNKNLHLILAKKKYIRIFRSFALFLFTINCHQINHHNINLLISHNQLPHRHNEIHTHQLQLTYSPALPQSNPSPSITTYLYFDTNKTLLPLNYLSISRNLTQIYISTCIILHYGLFTKKNVEHDPEYSFRCHLLKVYPQVVGGKKNILFTLFFILQ